MKLALQLYTINELCKKDFFGALELTAKAGYHGVEFAGLHGKTASEVKEKLDSLGLYAAGAHIGYETLSEDICSQISQAKELGLQSVCVPYFNSESFSEWVAFAKDLDRIGELFRKEGIIFGFHNHAHELTQTFDRKNVMDIVLEHCDPHNVVWEMDTHWVVRGGYDPAERAMRYKDRMPLLHAKDIDREGRDIEAGCGTVKFDDIVGILKNDLCWIIVEQEEFERDPAESIVISADNMLKYCG